MKRRRYTPEQKVLILREHLEKNISVPDICEKHRIHPNQFYRWKKEFFENAVEAFSRKRGRKKDKNKTSRLEEKLKDRNQVIAELLEENLKLKKADKEI
ncbi:MAG: transposase [bacterium]